MTNMKKFVIILILFTFVLFFSGCIENTQENSTNKQNILNNSSNSQNILNKSIEEVTEFKQINISLQKSPIFLELGEKGCDDCQAMKPILAQVAAEYGGKITVMSVDINQSPELAKYFGANVVPVSFMILDIKSGNYTYLQEDDNISMDKFKAKIIGFRDKDNLEKIMDTAIQQEKNKSK